MELNNKTSLDFEKDIVKVHIRYLSNMESI